MRTFVIIPSAGKGSRMKSSLPKQFLKINGKEILVHTLEKFQNAKLVDSIIVCASKEFIKKTESLIKRYGMTKVSNVVIGGKERQDSVYSGLKSLRADSRDLVCVHDAVRPFITSEEIDDLIKFATKKKAVIAAKKAVDTIKTGSKVVESTLDRKKLWIVQTPQIFNYEILIKAFDKAYKENFLGTDESSLVERLGIDIHFYELESDNRKITYPFDLKLAKILLV